jgi:hypothetical protein
MLMRKNVGKLLKNVEKNVGNISEKCWWEKRLANFQKMLTRKNVGNTSKKMLTKNVGNAPKNIDEKMLTTVLTKKCSQHFQKCWWKKS